MALLKMFRVAAATLMLAGVSAPAFAQESPQTVEDVVAACETGDCDELVKAFLANVPAAQLDTVKSQLGRQLEAARNAATAAGNQALASRISLAVTAAATYDPSTTTATVTTPGFLDQTQTASGSPTGNAPAGNADRESSSQN
ncbi:MULTISPECIES: hypothetical protein [unclassified Pannonibacter]|uniref:hypothetical protein n=1 Tax=unclassified Pannonibacter TaxID=2627228 RepID=UPI001644F821|nr:MULTISPECIES: hypothetical protein [unclassified Pannonibacter]